MKPYPPKICVASLALSMAAFEAVNLAMAAAFLTGSPAASRAGGGVVPRQPGGLRPCRHVGELELDGLVMAEPVTECGPLADIPQALVHAALGEPHGQRGNGDPPLVQDLQELGVPAALLTQQMIRGYPAGREGQFPGIRGTPADLGVVLPDGEPGGSCRDDDG